MLPYALDDFRILIFAALTIAIYGVILVVFFKVRRKYRGGIVENAIKYLIAAICLFLLADIAFFLVPSLGPQWGYTVHLILKLSAMTCLAKSGLEFFAG
jgi:hypothetical protein